MEVNVLGTIYEIEKLDEKDSCMLKNNADAYVDYTEKKIFLHKDDIMINASLRHELVHAFIFSYGHTVEGNEAMCDFFGVHGDEIIDLTNQIMGRWGDRCLQSKK